MLTTALLGSRLQGHECKRKTAEWSSEHASVLLTLSILTDTAHTEMDRSQALSGGTAGGGLSGWGGVCKGKRKSLGEGSLGNFRGNSPANLTFGLFSDSFETSGRTLWALLGPCPGVLFPDSFRTLPGFRARRARETLCGAGPIANIPLLEPLQYHDSPPQVPHPLNSPSHPHCSCAMPMQESGSFFHPQPPSLLILLAEPGSERKLLTKET